MTEIPIGSNIATAPAGDRLVTRAALGVPARAPLLAPFGIVYQGKGLETLLEALAILKSAQPQARLVVVGDTREPERAYRADLEALAVRLGVARAVTWTGRRPAGDVSRILGAADVFVAPFDEGASLRRGSLMAGLAHGLPVVSTATAVASPYLRDGDNIALVPPRDAAALAARLAASLRRDQGSSEYDALVTFPVERYEDRVTLMRVRGHRWTAGALPPFSLSAVAAVRRAVAAVRPDVLNVHYAMPTGLAGVVAERRLGVPTVLTMNGRDVPGPGVPALWRWWQRALIALVTDATYVSGYCRDAIYGPGRGRGEVIANGVEIPPPPGDGTAVRAALEAPPGDCLVFALQRLAPEKRVDTLLRALRRCLDGGVAVTLVIGGTGPEAPALRALAAELGIDKHVRFAGYLPRTGLGGYFEACDLFAFHSTYETFGLVVAQAMSYGRAVVTLRSTALPEVVGDAGLLVPPGHPLALADAIAALAQNPARRRALGEAGRRRAAALYAWDRVADGYERVLARAAEARRAG